MVEQGTHKPLVGGSIPPLAIHRVSYGNSMLNKERAIVFNGTDTQGIISHIPIFPSTMMRITCNLTR